MGQQSKTNTDVKHPCDVMYATSLFLDFLFNFDNNWMAVKGQSFLEHQNLFEYNNSSHF